MLIIEYNILHALPSQTVFDFLSQWQNKLCRSISDTKDYIWLAKTSNKAISLSTRLAVKPYLWSSLNFVAQLVPAPGKPPHFDEGEVHHWWW